MFVCYQNATALKAASDISKAVKNSSDQQTELKEQNKITNNNTVHGQIVKYLLSRRNVLCVFDLHGPQIFFFRVIYSGVI